MPKTEDVSDELVLHEMRYRDGSLDMKLGGEPAMQFMMALVELFEQNGGKNFLTITIAGQDKKYGITIQNCHGVDTPAEKMSRMESLLRGVLDGCDESGKPLADFAERIDAVREYFEREYSFQTSLRG